MKNLFLPLFGCLVLVSCGEAKEETPAGPTGPNFCDCVEAEQGSDFLKECEEAFKDLTPEEALAKFEECQTEESK